ncbi:DUF397 domain-containing protein [Spongiactinospora gelatinilytica]|uniref:DUF397 domain-containing protein n=2 Tax=Streptosporangiaceae TaxID=2004 RepID=A0A2W2GX09_9ACTN|nr:DUF397 domain-containing protein [Spongiactinospora gelatinilytica]
MITVTPEELRAAAWRKSSHSNAGGDCVETAVLNGGIVAVRDSKDPDGPVLLLGERHFRRFIADIKTGRLER